MSAYLVLELFVLLGAVINRILHNRHVCNDISNCTNYFVYCYLILSLFIGLRGDFVTDYANYEMLFNHFTELNIEEIVRLYWHDEVLYKIAMWFIGNLTHSYIVFLLVNSFITTYCFLKTLKKRSELFWLSVLMLLSVGIFFTGMNIMRQILVASIVSLAFKYIAENKFLKFLSLILICFFMHTSVFIMIPFFFVLRKKWNSKMIKISMILFIAIVIIIDKYARDIMQYAMLYYTYSEMGYGLDFGLSIEAMAKVVLGSVFIVLGFKKINMNCEYERVMFNASLVYLMFYIFSSEVAILQRFSYYFAISHLILIPNIINRILNPYIRISFVVSFALLCLMYSYITLGDGIFCWFWET